MSSKGKSLSIILNIFKSYKHMSVRWALVFFVLVGIVLPFIIFSAFISSYVNNFMNNMLIDSVNQSVKNNSTQLESIVESLNYTSAFLSTSPYVIDQVVIMDTHSNYTTEAIIARDNLVKYIKAILNATLNTSNPQITVITRKGRVVEMEKVYNLDIEFDKLISNNFAQNRIVWDNALNPGLSTSLKATWIIHGLGEGKDTVGLLIIDIPGDMLWSKLASRSSFSSTQMLIKDSGGKVISVSNLTDYYTNFNNYSTSRDNNILISDTVGSWGLELVAVTPINAIAKQLTALRSFTLLCFIILIIILLFVLNFISKYISHPIVLLTEYIHRVQLGKYNQKPNDVYFKDMDILSKNLVEVSECIEKLMETTINQAIAKEKMYFDTLRAQINPHFLYNTLNSIKWMASINGDHTVSNMITDLGKILNNVLGKHGDNTTLKAELDVLNSYITLQKMRYGETFIYEVDANDELMDCLVPRFTLQPLVENAIVHGVFSKNNGIISISAHKQDDILFISVKDNGSGMDNKDAQKLLKSPEAPGYSTGIGVTNVHERIQILYGKEYGLKIQSEIEKGFHVSMEIPYIVSNDKEQLSDFTS